MDQSAEPEEVVYLARLRSIFEALSVTCATHRPSSVYTVVRLVSSTEEPCALCGAGSYVAHMRTGMAETHFGVLGRHITKRLQGTQERHQTAVFTPPFACFCFLTYVASGKRFGLHRQIYFSIDIGCIE